MSDLYLLCIIERGRSGTVCVCECGVCGVGGCEHLLLSDRSQISDSEKTVIYS